MWIIWFKLRQLVTSLREMEVLVIAANMAGSWLLILLLMLIVLFLMSQLMATPPGAITF